MEQNKSIENALDNFKNLEDVVSLNFTLMRDFMAQTFHDSIIKPGKFNDDAIASILVSVLTNLLFTFIKAHPNPEIQKRKASMIVEVLIAHFKLSPQPEKKDMQ